MRELLFAEEAESLPCREQVAERSDEDEIRTEDATRRIHKP